MLTFNDFLSIGNGFSGGAKFRRGPPSTIQSSRLAGRGSKCRCPRTIRARGQSGLLNLLLAAAKAIEGQFFEAPILRGARGTSVLFIYLFDLFDLTGKNTPRQACIVHLEHSIILLSEESNVTKSSKTTRIGLILESICHKLSQKLITLDKLGR